MSTRNRELLLSYLFYEVLMRSPNTRTWQPSEIMISCCLLLVTCSLYRFRVSISAISAITIRAVNINQIESDLKKPGWGGWGTLCGHCAVIISRICFQYLTKYWCLWPHVSRWRAILSLAPARPQTHNWNQPSLSKLLTNKLGMVLELLDLDLLSPPTSNLLCPYFTLRHFKFWS